MSTSTGTCDDINNAEGGLKRKESSGDKPDEPKSKEQKNPSSSLEERRLEANRIRVRPMGADISFFLRKTVTEYAIHCRIAIFSAAGSRRQGRQGSGRRLNGKRQRNGLCSWSRRIRN